MSGHSWVRKEKTHSLLQHLKSNTFEHSLMNGFKDHHAMVGGEFHTAWNDLGEAGGHVQLHDPAKLLLGFDCFYLLSLLTQ